MNSTSTSVKPLNVKNKLAGNPNLKPKYSKLIKTPEGTIEAVDPRATRALVALMDMNAVLGGAASHYGGPAAFAELMSALHAFVFNDAAKKTTPWHQLFHVVNDAGHCENGLYALKANYGFADLTLEKLKKFRSIDSVLTGHGESHLFPEAVLISNGPLGSAFPVAQGLAMADAFNQNQRVTVTAISDGACMEGEAREAMAAIPGLAANGQMAPFVLIISDNNTKLTGRIDKDSFSMNPSFEAFKTLGWKVISLADGHDLQKCYDCISQAIAETRANPKVPVVIHAKTIKGIGTKKTAESASGGHGFPLKSPTELPEFLKEIYEGEYPAEFNAWIEELKNIEKQMAAQAKKSTVPDEKIQAGISQAMVKAHQNGLPIVSITSDLPGSTGVAGFRKEFPKSSFDVGVAESNMISVAAGFSKAGYIPVVDTFAQFGVTKGALPITMASLSEAPVICIFSHTGFQDAADGASHQALTYLAMMSSIPDVHVYCLSCSEEAASLMTQAIEQFADFRKQGKTPPTTVFFLGRENFPKAYVPGARYQLGKAQLIAETEGARKVTIVASGSSVHQAVLAAEDLKSSGIGTLVVNASSHNRIDTALVRECLKKSDHRLITVEDHQKIGGFGQALAASLFEEHVSAKVKILAVHGEFGQSAYTAQDLYAKHQIDSTAIVRAAKELV